MANKIISMSVDPTVYSKYMNFCKEEGLVMSKQIELYMKKKLEEEGKKE